MEAQAVRHARPIAMPPAVTVAVTAVIMVMVQRLLLFTSAVAMSAYKHHDPTLQKLLVNGYNHWDSWWYIGIAQHGYTSFKATAFWPMYPLVMHVLHALTGGQYMVIGVVVSTLCFGIALFYLGLLVREVFDMPTAAITMALYAFFPTSYYFDSTYTEALFMALLIASAYYAHMGKFFTAGILAAFATMTRNTGIILSVVLLAEILRLRQPGWKFWVADWWRKTGVSVLSLAIAPLTLFGYCLWLQSRFGHFFAFVDAEKYWHRTNMAPWDTIAKAFQSMDVHMNTPGYHAFEIASIVLAIGCLVAGLFMVKRSLTMWSWWMYAAAVVWIISAAPALGRTPDFLMSVPRFILLLFPCFIFLARVTQKFRCTPVVLILFAALLFAENAMFYAGMWIA